MRRYGYKKQKYFGWTVPNSYQRYFSMSSDDEFKKKHPTGYIFLVILGIVALLLPGIVYAVVMGAILGVDSYWILLGWAGSFIFGIGLFNFVAIIIDQYLGHWLSIICFLLGGGIALISALLCL